MKLKQADIDTCIDITNRVEDEAIVPKLIQIHEKRIAETRSARSREMHKLSIALLRERFPQ